MENSKMSVSAIPIKETYPKFEAASLGDNCGWRVDVTVREGKVEQFYGFRTEAEARSWMERERIVHQWKTNLKTMRVKIQKQPRRGGPTDV
jgi:hypothetical protein